VKTLAASGIPKLREMLGSFGEMSPLRRTVTPEDVGKAALFLLSPQSGAMTGEIMFVDCGFNTIGM